MLGATSNRRDRCYRKYRSKFHRLDSWRPCWCRLHSTCPRWRTDRWRGRASHQRRERSRHRSCRETDPGHKPGCSGSSSHTPRSPRTLLPRCRLAECTVFGIFRQHRRGGRRRGRGHRAGRKARDLAWWQHHLYPQAHHPRLPPRFPPRWGASPHHCPGMRRSRAVGKNPPRPHHHRHPLECLPLLDTPRSAGAPGAVPADCPACVSLS